MNKIVIFITLFLIFRFSKSNFCELRPQYYAVENALSGSKQVILQVSESNTGGNITSCLQLHDNTCNWESSNSANWVFVGFGVNPVRVVSFSTQGNLISNWPLTFKLDYMATPGTAYVGYLAGVTINGNSDASSELRRIVVVPFEAYAVRIKILSSQIPATFTMKFEVQFEMFCRS